MHEHVGARHLQVKELPVVHIDQGAVDHPPVQRRQVIQRGFVGGWAAAAKDVVDARVRHADRCHHGVDIRSFEKVHQLAGGGIVRIAHHLPVGIKDRLRTAHGIVRATVGRDQRRIGGDERGMVDVRIVPDLQDGVQMHTDLEGACRLEHIVVHQVRQDRSAHLLEVEPLGAVRPGAQHLAHPGGNGIRVVDQHHIIAGAAAARAVVHIDDPRPMLVHQIEQVLLPNIHEPPPVGAAGCAGVHDDIQVAAHRISIHVHQARVVVSYESGHLRRRYIVVPPPGLGIGGGIVDHDHRIPG